MELPLESVATETDVELATAAKERRLPDSWGDVRSHVRRYLAAWRLGDDDWLNEGSEEILRAVRSRLGESCEEDRARAAMEEAEAFVAAWFQKVLPHSGRQENGVSVRARMALLLGSSPDKRSGVPDPLQLNAAWRQGGMSLERALLPSRPPETRAFSMQTSLSRLPSMRLIAGWFLLVAALGLAFFLTH